MRGLLAFLGSVALGAALFVVVVVATAPRMPPVAESSETQRFKMARAGAGDLITGTVADWRAADREARMVYAMGSARALTRGGLDVDEAELTQRFLRCMDRNTARDPEYRLLGDISYECAQTMRAL